MFLKAGLPTRVAGGRTIRYPDGAFAVDEKTVRECDLALAEALDELAAEIDFDDGVKIGIGATISAAAVENPEVLAIGVHPDPAGHSDFSSLEFVPVVVHMIWIHRYLGMQPGSRDSG